MSYGISNKDVLRKVTNDYFVGASVGTSNIAVAYEKFNATVLVTVVTESVLITTLAITPIDTLLGIPGHTSALRIYMKLSDESSVGDIISGYAGYTASQVTSQLVNITSAAPDFIRVLQNGVIVLMGNSASRVTITAAALAGCGSVTKHSIFVAANLKPVSQGDVDMGLNTGVPIPTLLSSSFTSVDVRIRSEQSFLRGFDIVLAYDNTNVEVKDGSCLVVSEFAVGGGCTVGSSGSIKIVGVSTAYSQQSTDAGVTIASFGMRAKPTQRGTVETLITGSCIEFVRQGGSSTNLTELVAGKIPFLVNTGDSSRRRLLQSNVAQVVAVAPNLGSDLSATRSVYGDTNLDGRFSILDILFMLEFFSANAQLGCPVTGGNTCVNRSSLTDWQMQQLTPVGDSSTGGRDIAYLAGVMLGKFHFVANVSIVTSAQKVNVGIRLLDAKVNTLLILSPVDFIISLFAIAKSPKRHKSSDMLLLSRSRALLCTFKGPVGSCMSSTFFQACNHYIKTRATYSSHMLSYAPHVHRQDGSWQKSVSKTMSASLKWCFPLRHLPHLGW